MNLLGSSPPPNKKSPPNKTKKSQSPQFLCSVCEERAAASLPGAARTLCLAQVLPGHLPLDEGWCHLHPPSPTVGIFPSLQQHSLWLGLSQFLRSMECCCTHGSAQPALLGGNQLNKVEKTTLTVSFSKYKSLFFGIMRPVSKAQRAFSIPSAPSSANNPTCRASLDLSHSQSCVYDRAGSQAVAWRAPVLPSPELSFIPSLNLNLNLNHISPLRHPNHPVHGLLLPAPGIMQLLPHTMERSFPPQPSQERMRHLWDEQNPILELLHPGAAPSQRRGKLPTQVPRPAGWGEPGEDI